MCIVRFQPPDEPQDRSWLVLKVRAPAGSWLLFARAPGELRRLAPVPEGWELLRPAELTALLERATPSPSPYAPPLRVSRPSPVVAATATEPAEELLWERERRLALEELLREREDEVEQLTRDLASANAELRYMEMELQSLMRALQPSSDSGSG